MPKCTGTKPDGTRCKAWAVHETDPPRCVAHGGGKSPVGAPAGNKNAIKHGAYATRHDDTLDPTSQLLHNINKLYQYIQTHHDDLAPDAIINLYGLHGQLVSRYGRLTKGQAGRDAEFQAALDRALERAWQKIEKKTGVAK